MRAALILVALLAACSRGEDKGAAAGGAAKQAAAATEADADPNVRCAIAAVKRVEPVCTREVTNGPDGETWIVRHPNGGFRRFVLIDKGTKIATADGADEVRTERKGPDLEVRVGADIYLFPAAPEASAAAPPPTLPHAPAT